MKEFIKKICICGDPAVGKTSLIRRFVQGKYDEKYITTLGTVITKKLVQFPELGYQVNLQVWDISGQSEFKRTHASAFRSAEAAIAVCDVTRPETAQSLYQWIDNLRKHSKHKVPVIVLANKFDLAVNNPTYMEKINLILENINCPLFTTSAKTGTNVEIGFEILAERIASIPTILPKTALELVTMPEIFENPYALLDYVLVRYSRIFGEQEMSVHLMRSQAEGRGESFQQMPKEETLQMINHMIKLINDFKSEDEAKQLRMEFMEAYKRCNWG